MKLILSFSGRADGNCDQITEYLAAKEDRVVAFRDLKIHPCADCEYECFHGECKWRADGCYALYESMRQYDKVILVVPMYCGNPSSLYFVFNERCQDYFMHNDDYEELVQKLYIIGVYGNQTDAPDFLPCLAKWFEGTACHNHVLGLERHQYHQKIEDRLLDVAEVREQLSAFLSA